jgi:hypothetical protein
LITRDETTQYTELSSKLSIIHTVHSY